MKEEEKEKKKEERDKSWDTRLHLVQKPSAGEKIEKKSLQKNFLYLISYVKMPPRAE